MRESEYIEIAQYLRDRPVRAAVRPASYALPTAALSSGAPSPFASSSAPLSASTSASSVTSPSPLAPAPPLASPAPVDAAPLLDFAALDELAAAHDDAEVAEWTRRFPRVHVDTLLNIAWQLHARACKRATPAQRAPHHLARCTARFATWVSIAEMALSARFSPCLLLKMLLPVLDAQRWTRTAINACLKSPERCTDARLRAEMELCVVNDRHFSPDAEAVRRMIGAQKEAELEWRLRELGVPFENEQALRARGFAKTPDFHLLSPIAVAGRVVCWIDSKAMFGDPVSHRALVDEQLRIYVNRFGPGMVIYWFGFVDELNCEGDVDDGGGDDGGCGSRHTASASTMSTTVPSSGARHPAADADILCMTRMPLAFDDAATIGARDEQ